MRVRYRDWTEKELETTKKLVAEGTSIAAISRLLKRPYGQTASAVDTLQREDRWVALGHGPTTTSVRDLRTLAGKLRKLKSPHADICDEAAEYICELQNHIRERTGPTPKSPWHKDEQIAELENQIITLRKIIAELNK